MNQRELNREIAKATGETVSTISQLGFVPLTRLPYEREHQPQTVDWDEADANRNFTIMPRRTRTPVVV